MGWFELGCGKFVSQFDVIFRFVTATKGIKIGLNLFAKEEIKERDDEMHSAKVKSIKRKKTLLQGHYNLGQGSESKIWERFNFSFKNRSKNKTPQKFAQFEHFRGCFVLAPVFKAKVESFSNFRFRTLIQMIIHFGWQPELELKNSI